MKAFVRIDKEGKIIPGSNINRKSMPKIGKWKEISLTLCCEYIPVILSSFDSYNVSEATCDSFTEQIILYFNGVGIAPSFGDSVFYNEQGTLPVVNGFYTYSGGGLWFQIEDGVVVSTGDCGR